MADPVMRTHWRREVRRFTIATIIVTGALVWAVYGR